MSMGVNYRWGDTSVRILPGGGIKGSRLNSITSGMREKIKDWHLISIRDGVNP